MQNEPNKPNPDDTTSTLRGFAAHDPEMRRAIASKAGKAAHEKGRAHEFTTEEARNAGHKGGLAVSANREHMATIGKRGGDVVSANREHMATIGKRGGDVVAANRDHMATIGRRGGTRRRAAAAPAPEALATRGAV